MTEAMRSVEPDQVLVPRAAWNADRSKGGGKDVDIPPLCPAAAVRKASTITAS
jgi:hypothetical protein